MLGKKRLEKEWSGVLVLVRDPDPIQSAGDGVERGRCCAHHPVLRAI